MVSQWFRRFRSVSQGCETTLQQWFRIQKFGGPKKCFALLRDTTHYVHEEKLVSQWFRSLWFRKNILRNQWFRKMSATPFLVSQKMPKKPPRNLRETSGLAFLMVRNHKNVVSHPAKPLKNHCETIFRAKPPAKPKNTNFEKFISLGQTNFGTYATNDVIFKPF